MPVFNSEVTLPRILDGIIKQTYTNWELIVVNDGSTDNSLMLLNNYQKLDTRITVKNKVNGGVASARQIGLDNINGEYVIHVDSDDMVEETYLEKLINFALEQNTDITICNYFVETEKSVRQISHPNFINGDDMIYAMVSGAIIGTLWNKLIRTSIIRDNSIAFLSEINYCEDQLFLIRLLQSSDIKIGFINDALYRYIFNPKSITRKITKSTYLSIERYINELKLILPSEGRFNVIKDKLAIGLFQAGIQGRIFSNKDIANNYQPLRPYLHLCKSRRWQIVFLLIRFHIYWGIRFIV